MFNTNQTYVDIRSATPTPSIAVSVPAFGSGQAPSNETVTIASDVCGFDTTNNFGSATMDGAPINLGSVGNPGADGSVRNGSIVIDLSKAPDSFESGALLIV